MDLFRRKSIDELQAAAAASGMLKNLAAVDLLMLGIGAVIGTGIFVLTGVAAAKYAGPAVPLSFILSGLTCALAGLAYAEFASIVPASGSAYTYAYASLGEFIAFIVGWNLILEYTVTSSAVAVGWSGYVVGLFASAGLVLPHELVVAPAEGGIFNLPAVLITLFLSFLLVRGTKESVKLNRILVFVKLAAIFLFLVLAAPHVDATNWEPFLPFGYSGVVSGAAIVFFAYIGFDAVATTAEECRNAARDLPVGIIGSLFICTLLYAVVAAVLTGVVPYSMLDTAEPVAFALRHIGYNVGSAIVAVGAICGITTVLLVLLYGQARIFFAMSRDGMVPANVCKIHRRFHTPYRVTILGAIFVSAIAGVFPIGMIAEMANIGTLSAFLIASIGVMVLRKTEPDLKRNFKCPAVWLIAPLAVLSCGYLMANLPLATWHRFGFWILFGLCVYFGYSRAHSVIGRRAAEEAAKEEKR
ncbi:amino acid permease [Selenomonas sputigena]|uniref:Amino acid permease-associated region n=1 Tax=Selenomonas sputigena (strain ATCC 35185 / DSM 20758 / CCUG 44933 / VPI D19B-28) TaxID=546271 RepID=C9LV03_SELS3|nr:amino acid permease [Selenomonas sputigena]AEC01215.1 amino acid permease-associated region [Selenomonas sputigena ATCC 35185]EEX77313.1 amino acid transporter [Selenomonas sputigena ATCC 35185]